MANHDFPFEGGDILKNMGATWFVSYVYYDHCDKSHMNWDNVRTSGMRISCYNKSKRYHKQWLQHVLSMNDANLSKNTLGVAPCVTKQMAKELLAKCFYPLSAPPS